jgi:hypothetical protein
LINALVAEAKQLAPILATGASAEPARSRRMAKPRADE